MRRRFLGAVVLLLAAFNLSAQSGPHAMGCVLDDDAYEHTPVKPRLLTRSYETLPLMVNWESYCPTPADQGSYGTCTSWAVAYAARSIMEAIALNRAVPEVNAQEAFSPSFVYYNIKNPADTKCQNGSSIENALQLLYRQGVPRKSTFYSDCASYIPQRALTEAGQYKISDYFTLFRLDADSNRKISSTKMALAQGRPVIISMECYDSFSYVKHVWNGNADVQRGYHAMCVVGYDDNESGGAFRIMNSWGTSWAEGGFAWVRYADFARYVRYGYEMYLPPVRESAKLSGHLKVRLNSGNMMSLKRTGNDGCCVYRALRSYPSGTQYRVLVSNDSPAYVYLIGSDLSCRPEVLFPPSPKVSPALVYSANDIAVPDERWDIQTDNTVGTDYLCILYSHSALDINVLVSRIATLDGSFPQRVCKALGTQCVPVSEINFAASEVRFSTASAQTTVPIIIEIPHSR